MLEDQWQYIRHFTKQEIIDTGADDSMVKFEMLRALDRFRELVDCPVILIKNGLTTGNHKSKGHPQGWAVDCYISKKVGTDVVFKAALEAGFRAIGIYWNGNHHSFHLEIDEKYRFWLGVKEFGDEGWTMLPLLNPAVPA